MLKYLVGFLITIVLITTINNNIKSDLTRSAVIRILHKLKYVDSLFNITFIDKPFHNVSVSNSVHRDLVLLDYL